MPIIDSIHLYPQINQYWDLVRRTLEEIFGVDPAQADTLRREIKTWTAQEQLLFYHAEPLDVAADLAGRLPTQHEVESYTKRAAALGWYIGWTPKLLSELMVLASTVYMISPAHRQHRCG